MAQDLRGVLFPPDQQDPSEYDRETQVAHQHDLHMVRNFLPLSMVRKSAPDAEAAVEGAGVVGQTGNSHGWLGHDGRG